MTTAFTTWSAFRTHVLDALNTYVAEGSPITKSYTAPDGRRHEIRSIEEFERLIKLCDIMVARETAGSPSDRVTYGRYRRFR
ncbi:MAG: hypothetical protein ABII06_06315 [Pseudomonadota bacterium]